ncbi:MAG: response regulator transcription factor [Flavobacteriales bacterium]|nr:response regulator transcription factor [Flavobacteriales bacterium]
MRLLIADDDPLIADQLLHFATKLGAEAKVVPDGAQALAALKSDPPDAVVLDLHMPGLSGPELLASIGDRVPAIIVSGDSSFALESYRFRVLDYLLKPVTFDAFARALRKLDAPAPSANGNDHVVFVRSGTEIARVDLREVRFMKSESNYVRFTFADKEITTLMNMRDLERKLPSSFVRVHRSFIVNLDHVDRLDSNDIKVGRALVPVSDSYREELLSRLRLL